MKSTSLFSILLLSSVAIGQTSTPANKPSATPQATTASAPAAPKHEDAAKTAIAADAVVITVPNVCDSADKDCKTVVTRKQFESTLMGVSGGEMVPPEMPKRFASQYSEMVVFAKEAEKLGLEKEADTTAALQFARLRVLAERYLRVLREKSEPSQTDIQKYYESNKAMFQGVSLDRVMIPTGHAKSKKPEELKSIADDMKKRLTSGEDAAKLQQEVYATLELTNPPRTSVMLRRGAPEQDALLELPNGAVSDVIDDQMVMIVYKSHGKIPVPLDVVKEEIREKVYQQKLQENVKALLADHKSILNDAYFGKDKSGSKGPRN